MLDLLVYILDVLTDLLIKYVLLVVDVLGSHPSIKRIDYSCREDGFIYMRLRLVLA